MNISGSQNKKKFFFKGGELYYTDEGRGPVVVLLHGYLMNSDAWIDFRTRLSSTYRLICPDLPGHGASSSWGYVHTMDFMADAIYGLLCYLRIQKCSMAGHSMGGYVTLAFAEKYMTMLRGFGLFFSTPLADSEEKKRDRIRAMQVIKRKKIFYVRETLKGLFLEEERKYVQEAFRDIRRSAECMDPRGAIAALRGMIARPDREMVMKFSPVPVFCINGLKDSVIPPSIIREIMQRQPKVHFVLDEKLGHMGHIEYPGFCILQLRKFLRKIHS